MSEENTTPQVDNTTEDVSAVNNSTETTPETVDKVEDNTANTPPIETENKTQEEQIKVENIDINDDKAVADTLTSKGFDFNKLQDEWEQYGDITAETREALAQQGITKEILDGYIEGRIAIVQKQMDEIAESIGGKDEFEAIRNWAIANLTEDEKKAIDKVHEPILIKGILRDLKARMHDSDGYLPKQVQGDGSTTSADLFQSMAEVQEAIRNPKYAKDEVYRAKVAQKITASREAGLIKF